MQQTWFIYCLAAQLMASAANPDAGAPPGVASTGETDAGHTPPSINFNVVRDIDSNVFVNAIPMNERRNQFDEIRIKSTFAIEDSKTELQVSSSTARTLVNTRYDSKSQTVLGNISTQQPSLPAELEIKEGSKLLAEQQHRLLPALFGNSFEITIYYTFLESGIDLQRGYSRSDMQMRTRKVNDKSISAKRAFWNAVMMEGMGKLDQAQHGIEYVGYDITHRRFFATKKPVGVRNIELLPAASCAVDKRVIVHGWKLQVLDENIKKIFGDQVFTAHDVGGGIRGYHLDLYLGEAETSWRRSGLPTLPDNQTWYGGKRIAVALHKIEKIL